MHIFPYFAVPSRGIWGFLLDNHDEQNKAILFPSPLEVSGGSYVFIGILLAFWILFPSPLEVSSGSYKSTVTTQIAVSRFPSPLEVSGGSYTRKELEEAGFGWFPSPLEVSGGSYPLKHSLITTSFRFRPLSRYLGVPTDHDRD